MRNIMYLRRYEITLDDYERMLEEQNGVCKICGNPPLEHELAVDHDHETGYVRGLLCVPCNVGLVHVERPGWLKKAQAYLNEI
jgi:hypothetical protein